MQSTSWGAAKRTSVAWDVPAAAAPAARATVAAAVTEYSVELFWGRLGLEQIAAQRARLAGALDARRFDNFVDWYTAYIETSAANPDHVCFCAVLKGVAAAAILPLELVTRRHAGLKIASLELPNDVRMPTGDSIVTDGGDPTAYLPLLLQTLLGATRPRWHYLRLTNAYATDPLAAALGRLRGHSHFRPRTCGADGCPVVPEEEQLARLPKNFARKIRQNRKRLAGVEEATFVTATAGAELERAYEEFLEVESANWKGAEGSRTAIVFQPQLRVFYEQLLCRLSQRGAVEIHLLRLGQKPIAGQYTFVTDDTIYILKIGYDQDYAHLSPGVLLLDRLFRYAAAKPGIKNINFTTDMPWMKDWRPSCEDIYDQYLFRHSVRGQLARAYWHAAVWLERYRRERLAPLYRRLVGSRAWRYRMKREKESRDER